jgi:membrane protease YdiL (CAAX protease family)
MNAAAQLEARTASGLGAWVGSAVLLAGLATIVGGRWWATRAGLDPLAVGAAFGLALAALAIVRRPLRNLRVPGRELGTGIVIGIGFGLVLVALVLIGAAIGGSTLVPGVGRPATAFLPWAAITILVASGEEGLLRGRLFDGLRHAGGLLPAIVVTTVAFALMHVPLYGWHVVPLDLAVGLALGGLRLATGGVIAPASAHALADIATWWLPL